MSFHDTMDAFDQVRHQTHHALLREYDPNISLRTNESIREHADGKQMVYASYTMTSEFFIEAVAYQQAAIEEMERRAFSVRAMHPIKDKRSRLRVAARYIKNGTVKFPRKGCEDLINQLLGFGVEKHDDLCDALVWLILGVAEEGIEQQRVVYA